MKKAFFKGVKPVYLYLASGLFLLVSKAFENGDPLIFNLFLGLGLSSFIFRTRTDGKRLAAKNLIPKKDLWKLVIPGKRFDYFRELYLK